MLTADNTDTYPDNMAQQSDYMNDEYKDAGSSLTNDPSPKK